MILTDYLLCEKSRQWEFAKQCGISHSVIRLPEDEAFNVNNQAHWQTVYDYFNDFGITPIIIEPMPNCLHDHIKLGDEKRDESIEKVIKMFPIMESLGINTVCFNFMANIGWLRTSKDIKERGDAIVTGFELSSFVPDGKSISEKQLWDNYTYFIVIDMFDKIYKGTFVGGNLTTAIKNKTHTGGAVIWGGIRDIEQMQKVDTQVYYRGIDPTPIRNSSMISFNGAVRLGDGEHAAMVLPGDIVYGCSGGVLFIPPQLVMEVVDSGAKTQVKDIFGFEMITLNKFTPAQIDKNTWTKEMLDLLMEFIKNDPRGAEYRELDWSREYELAINGDPNDTQSAL